MTTAAQAIEAQDQKFTDLGLTKTIVNASQVQGLCTYSRGLGSVSESNPVIVLIHGYPQSSYSWRHFIPLLPPTAPLFVPDLPGYGASAPTPYNDKLSVGNILLTAVKTLVQSSSTSSSIHTNIPVILVGHDRGARVAHRLAVTKFQHVTIQAICLVDIVPTRTQWHASSNSREITGYFHWAFLAKVEQATKMIAAYGGDRWARDMITSWAGRNDAGRKSLYSDNALDIYAAFFTQPHTVESSCKDYEAGATVDVDSQEEDQKEGKKIGVPVLLIYSEEYIGRRYWIPGVWEEWVEEGVKIKSFAVEDGIGHFGTEEAPEVCARVFGEWVGELGGEVKGL